MAREPTITQEQVNAVADAIRAGGGKPTSRSVREQLGGGSMATVLRFLQVWQAGQVRQADAPIALPSALQRAIVDFLESEVASAKSTLESDLAAAQQANADLIAESERQERQIEEQAAAIEVLLAEKAALNGRLGQMESDLAVARDDANAERQGAEHARTELAKALLRLEGVPRLEADLISVRAELETERRSRIDAERLVAVTVAQKEDQDLRVQELRGSVERLTEANGQLQVRNDALAAELADARVSVQTGMAKLESVSRDLAELRQVAEQARGELRVSGEAAAELRGKLAALEKPKPKPRSKPAAARSTKASAR